MSVPIHKGPRQVRLFHTLVATFFKARLCSGITLHFGLRFDSKLPLPQRATATRCRSAKILLGFPKSQARFGCPHVPRLAQGCSNGSCQVWNIGQNLTSKVENNFVFKCEKLEATDETRKQSFTHTHADSCTWSHRWKNSSGCSS